MRSCKYQTLTAMDCYYHQKSVLTNFCMNPNCALPLCPKCINIHLSQSSKSHDIVSLGEAIQSVSQQVDIAYEGLGHQLKSLREDYEPQSILNDYRTMLDKYRKESVDEINRHYDYLERELLAEIGTRYSQKLMNLLVPLEDQLNTLQKAKIGINQHDRAIQTLIVVASQQSIRSAEEILTTIKDKKQMFKDELPRLQDGQNGKLKITAHRIDVVSPGRVASAGQVVSAALAPQSQSLPQSLPPPLPSPTAPLSGLDLIYELEARLQSLRHE